MEHLRSLKTELPCGGMGSNRWTVVDKGLSTISHLEAGRYKINIWSRYLLMTNSTSNRSNFLIHSSAFISPGIFILNREIC